MDVLLWFVMYSIFYQMPTAASVSGILLFASTDSIMELDVETEKVTVLVSHGGNRVYSLDYDYDNRYVYFTRFGASDIVRFPYPAQNITLQHVVNTSSYPVGVAVDSANDHVYWVHHYGDTLSRCKSDGTNVVVFTNFNYTFMIRLDVTNRWMYIANVITGISKSRFDFNANSMIATFISNRFYAKATCMDIDLTEQRLYWITYVGDIKSVNVDGTDVRTIISTNSTKFYYAIGVSRSNIYYANNSQLVMTSKSQRGTPTVLYTDTSRINSIYVLNSTAIDGYQDKVGVGDLIFPSTCQQHLLFLNQRKPNTTSTIPHPPNYLYNTPADDVYHNETDEDGEENKCSPPTTSLLILTINTLITTTIYITFYLGKFNKTIY